MKEENSYYYGLIFSCPMKDEIEACAYKDIRKLSLSERVNYIISLSSLDRTALIEKHRSCIRRRENKVPFSRIAIL